MIERAKVTPGVRRAKYKSQRNTKIRFFRAERRADRRERPADRRAESCERLAEMLKWKIAIWSFRFFPLYLWYRKGEAHVRVSPSFFGPPFCPVSPWD